MAEPVTAEWIDAHPLDDPGHWSFRLSICQAERMARRRLDGGWQIPPSALATDEQDRLRGRVRMLNGALEGGMESWTLPLEQWELVSEVILQLVGDADPDNGALLKTIVETAQARLGNHPAFPGGRLTNITRYVKVDLEGRGLLEVVPGSSPQRVRRGSESPPSQLSAK